jgi:hypothetical protein
MCGAKHDAQTKPEGLEQKCLVQDKKSDYASAFGFRRMAAALIICFDTALLFIEAGVATTC